MNVVEEHLDQIRALCQKHHVAKLFVLGSVLTDEFAEDSDIDFIVDFSEIELYEYADNYFDLKSSMERILGREIDLLENKAIKNPYLRKSIDSSKRLIYG